MKIPRIFGFLIITSLLLNTTWAKLVFVTEENAINESSLIINADDSSSDFVDLDFGSALGVKIRYDILNNKFVLNRDLQITQIIDSDGNTGTNGQVLISDGNGKNLWGSATANTIPYITTTQAQYMGTSSTKTLNFAGINFTPTSTISIPGFDGTINSTTILSPTEFQINVTSGTNTANYNIVVSNNGVQNTVWSGNGQNLLKVTDTDGTTQNKAGESCKKILDDGYSTGDGTYWINPDGGDTSNAFQVYCDMTSDGGGWTKIEYTSDLPHQNHGDGSGSDKWLWLTNNFSLALTDQQINDIRSVSTEGKQTYQGTCDGVIHYNYSNGNYNYAFGFRFQNGDETSYGQQNYTGTNITIPQDGCESNNSSSTDTIFEIHDIRVPVINVYSRDNGSSSELFGSPLTNNPAWLR